MLIVIAFNILPHPAKTNNPSDLNSDPSAHGGLQSAGANAYTAKGPHVPSAEIANSLEQPKSRDEVRRHITLPFRGRLTTCSCGLRGRNSTSDWEAGQDVREGNIN
jgi:hypothetical protein